jgi:subtilisin family serine protease
MNPLQLIKMNSLMSITTGKPEIVIGIIDGPVDTSHPDLKEAKIRKLQTISSSPGPVCSTINNGACFHGTFVAGILCARRGSAAPGISPGCTMIIQPIFSEKKNRPEVAPRELAAAIVDVVKAGARVINLSIGLSTTSMQEHRELKESFNYAFNKGVLLAAASGNHGRIGHIPLFNHPWVIPVASCDSRGYLDTGSNIGPSVGKWGLMAPGIGITSTSPGGGYEKMNGTSTAVPFVTGAIALLWSLFPGAAVGDVKRAILLHTTPGKTRSSIVPPLLDVEASMHLLRSKYKFAKT